MQRQDIQIRDPFILTLPREGSYYLYGTTDRNPWNSPGEGFDAYRSKDLETWEGPFQVFQAGPEFWGSHDFWAPEVHFSQGRYYMFASFIGNGRKRGTQILSSSSPLGPFKPLAKKATTPEDWQCLDGTLFVDEEARPWMVFCHEWVECNDGEVCAMRLSQDLREGQGEVQVLFRASEAGWTRAIERRDGSGLKDARVTDGPFLHRLPNGRLLMLWSSLGQEGYAMSYALSESGKIQGPWKQEENPIVAGDGGHGMLFRTLDGRLCLSYHSPNTTPLERFHFREVEELENGLRILD